MDSFIEYMIARKSTPVVKLKKFLIYLAAFVISMLIFPFMLISVELSSMLSLLFVGVFLIAYRLTCSFNIEYEYILTNGELDIDVITHKKRRKRILTIHSKSFIEFGKHKTTIENAATKEEFARIIDASSKSQTYDDYYAIFFKNGQKIKLIFNPTQKMIDVFKLHAPRAMKLDM